MRFMLNGSSGVAATFTPTAGKSNNVPRSCRTMIIPSRFNLLSLVLHFLKKSFLEIYFDELYIEGQWQKGGESFKVELQFKGATIE